MNDILIVNSIAAVLIIVIVWWFFAPRATKPEKPALVAAPIIVEVKNGVFDPALINIPSGQTVTLEFVRYDPSVCAEKIIFPQLNFSIYLPIREKKRLVLPPLEPGEFDFTCQMGMFKGKMRVI